MEDKVYFFVTKLFFYFTNINSDKLDITKPNVSNRVFPNDIII